MFVVRFITKFDESLPPCQKSSVQVLQSALGELGSGAANRSVNPELIWPLYILWTRHVCVGSDPSSPDPRPVVARSQPSSPNQHPSSPDFFLNFRTHCRALRTRYRKLWTRRRTLPPVVARCKPIVGHCGPIVVRYIPVVARCGPVVATLPAPPRTCPRQPYKYVCVFSFLYTLSEHPGLHLPRRLLAGFSTGC